LLQRLIWERLDSAIAWLEALGAPLVRAETGNPRTVGKRFDPTGLRDVLAARLAPGSVLETPAPLEQSAPAAVVILATGGFGASRELVARYIAPAATLRLRANRWSSGDGLIYALGRGGALSAGMDEFYGRNMPAGPWGEGDYVRLAQLYATCARIFDEDGEEFFDPAEVSWSETNVAQATARRPDAQAYYLLDAKAMSATVAGRSVAQMVATVPAQARPQLRQLPFIAPPGTVCAVRVTSAITHTIGGLRVDEHARVLGNDRQPLTGLYAAGVDVGGIAAGGYASGLAQALVLGSVAAESAVAEIR
jgi:succinate dehydrogenase/fumarate reductase flavoprotein subunit